VGTDARTQAVRVADVRRAITRNTVALVGSAPQFPHGTVDPIEELGARECACGAVLWC
jgi:sphinganine-1-phosphate aldolase